MIRQARERKGMTRAALAKFANISPNTMVKYEKAPEEGGRTPSLGKMVTLARILEIDPRWIFQRIYDFQKDQSDAIPSEKFSFNNHFANNTDFLNWKLSVKTIEELNDKLLNFDADFFYIRGDLKAIRQHLNESGPDQKDPSRSEISTTEPKAVSAASTNHIPKKEGDG
jgi:transcriptional regulator with XRE-family HTH domain